MAERIVDLLDEEWASIAALAATFDDAEWERPTALPGWSVKDNLSHIIGTERALLGDPPPDVDVTHLTHVRDDFGRAMEVWVHARRTTPGAEVLAEFHEVIPRRLAQLRAMTADQMAEVGWSPIGQVPYRRFMEVRAFDCWMHEQDMRRAVGRPGHGSGPLVDNAMVRFEAALGYIVGKKAGAGEGESVVFVVEGDPPRTYPVAVVEGRAKVVDAPPATPTCTITLPLESFVALGGGRWTAAEAEAAGGLTVAGDAELAERVLDAMAFTP